MKKGLIVVMAVLGVFAIIGCKTGSGPDDEITGGGITDGGITDGGTDGGNIVNGFVPPENWAGFTEAEMLAAKFYINQAEGEGDNPAGTSITKNADGSYSVTLKTVTDTDSRASVVWVDFEEAVFRNGWYASFKLPATGVRPVNVQVIPIPKGLKGNAGAIAWDCSQDAAVTGDLPATMDGLYVVGDLSMHWGTDQVKADDFSGLAIWLMWAPVGTANGEDYTFTIKDLKVLPYDASAPEPELEGWTPPAYDPVPVLDDWIDLPAPKISAAFPSGATLVENGSGGYTVTAKTTKGNHTEITFSSADFMYKGGYYLSLTLPDTTLEDTAKVKRIYTWAGNNWNSAVDLQQAYKWIQGKVDCMYEHEEFGVESTINLSIYWHPGVEDEQEYTFTIDSIKVKEETTEAPIIEKPEIDNEASQLEDAEYVLYEAAEPLVIVPVETDNSENYAYEWWKAESADATWPAEGVQWSGNTFIPPTDEEGTFYYYGVVVFGLEKTLTRMITITVNQL